MYVVSNYIAAVQSHREAVETSLGLPKLEGYPYGLGAWAGQILTEHIAPIIQSDDGKSWAFQDGLDGGVVAKGAKLQTKDIGADAAWSHASARREDVPAFDPGTIGRGRQK